MIKWLSLLFLVFFAEIAYTQSALTSQYQFNYLSINPAIAGESGTFAFKGILGNQFNGTIRPNQVSQILAIDGQLYNQSALSFQGFRTNVGNIISTGINLGYAKGFDIGELNLKLGINAGIFVQPNIITVAGQQRVAPYGGVGALLKYKNAWLGLSNPVAFRSKTIFEPRPFFLNLGYFYDKVPGFALNTNILAGITPQNSGKLLDLNAKAIFFDRLGLGASYRFRDIGGAYANTSVIPFVEVKVSRNFILGLSYDAKYGRINDNNQVANNPNGVFQLLIRFVATGAHEENEVSGIF